MYGFIFTATAATYHVYDAERQYAGSVQAGGFADAWAQAQAQWGIEPSDDTDDTWPRILTHYDYMVEQGEFA